MAAEVIACEKIFKQYIIIKYVCTERMRNKMAVWNIYLECYLVITNLSAQDLLPVQFESDDKEVNQEESFHSLKHDDHQYLTTNIKRQFSNPSHIQIQVKSLSLLILN